MSMSVERLPENTFNILVATDIHLGYAENDPIRGDDSFNTFEEILSIAAAKEVDFILLGGDLFHDNKPSPRCIHRCMSLIRQYCMGDRPVPIEFLSDQSENFQHCDNPVVNYEDPNLNISIPVFSIHGNHDDPSGQNRICSLDILSVSGLVNYFGKWDDLKQVKISPLLMKKGESLLALYGLSHITDDRLARLFRDQKVEFYQAKENMNEWFNIFTLHQNRVNRGLNKYIQDTVLPSFLDLVVWGHEHECLIEPEWNGNEEFRITQPGSPVATSLCEGEAVEKCIGLLKVHKKTFQLHPIKLKTVRPFVLDTVTLSKCRIVMSKSKPAAGVQAYLDEYVQNMIVRANRQITGHPKQPILPLIRLKVEYQNEQQAFNSIRFGEKFHSKIANPSSLILLRREKESSVKAEGEGLDKKAMGSVLDKGNLSGTMWDNRVENVVGEYFTTVNPNNNLQVLSVKGMAEAVKQFVDKDNKESIDILFNYWVKKTLDYLDKIDAKDEDIEKEVERLRVQRLAKTDEEVKDALTVLENKSQSIQRQTYSSSGDDDDDFGMIDGNATHGKGRGGRGRGRGRGRGKQEVEPKESTPDVPRGGRGKGRGRASTRARGRKEAVAQISITDSFSQSRRNSSRTTASKGIVMISDSDSS